jgi:glucuronokinase
MIIHTHAYARAGLIGNPSDGYFGKTISVILRNFRAEVNCYESPQLNVAPCQRDRMTFDSIADLQEDVRLHGYYGGLRLVKATVMRFGEYCRERGIDLHHRNFTLEYRTDIPMRVGLAGSSGIIIAALRALMAFYEVTIPDHQLANLALSVETGELQIGAGLQDRVIQAYEGAVYMDFDRELMASRGFGDYQALDPRLLPPLFVAYHEDLSEGTEVTHNDLRSRFKRGDPEVHAAMGEFAELTRRARELVAGGRGADIGPLLSANFDLRTRIVEVSRGNRRLVELARAAGSHAKLAGSGGAVIGTYDGDPQRLARLRRDYEGIGARLIEPEIRDKS